LWAPVALLAIAALGLAAGVVWWSGATLRLDAVALARVELQPLGGSLVSATATGPDGAKIPLVVDGGRLTPRALVAPGERVTVVVRVSRPHWLRWAVGSSRVERLTVRAPLPALPDRWLSVAPGAPLELRFAEPVDRISYRSAHGRKTVPVGGKRVVSLAVEAPSGTTEVASAVRPWERLGGRVLVTWFPVSSRPVVLVSPGTGEPISPRAPIRLTFSQPIDKALGAARPRLSARAPGRWSEVDSHTLVFTPSGFGFPLAGSLRLELPAGLRAVVGAKAVAPASTVNWTIAGAGFLRLQQLLADAGYLPVSWHPLGASVAQRLVAEINAAVDPPAGAFAWRYPNTPSELKRLWVVGKPNTITRGAVMMFEHDHGLPVDGSAGPQVWHALLRDAVAGDQRTAGYSYVYVHRNVPQLLTLWHNGTTVLTSPGNTGVPAAPTQLGTFAVFEHVPVGTMSGTNPDGSHYHDPGIRWISYFHRGEALHAFNRASYGTPQSLGCVELPLATAAKVWPYTPIGTLVTIEN
jgi:peptidoglycan hydrolase-like protein with peptidoglycan-binding domain